MIQDLWTSLLALAGQFIVPDWGALVALIPVGLAVIVVLYLAWTVYRFATAAPTSRGIQRMAPVTPAGVRLFRPSIVLPVLAVAGAFVLLFGLLSGGPWAWIGVAILLVALLAWGGEALRGRRPRQPR